MSTRSGDEQLAARQAGRAGGDLTAAELRAQTRQAEDAKARQQNRDAAKQFAKDEFKRAQAEAKAEGRTVTSQSLRINLKTGSVKGKTTSVDSAGFRREQDQSSKNIQQQEQTASRPKYGSEGEADFGIGTPLKGAPGRVQEQDSRGNISTTKFEKAETKGPTHYSVDINDSLSGYVPGKTHFKVNLYEGKSRPNAVDSSKDPWADAANPWKQASDASKTSKPDAKGGFNEGLANYAKNTKEDFDLGFFGSGQGIGALFRGATGQKLSEKQMKRIETRGAQAEARTEREFEREFVGAGISAGSKAIEGKADGKEFEKLGADVAKNPAYFAGSAAGSALSFVGPGGVRKVVSGITKGIGAVGIKGTAKTSEKVASQAMKEFNIKDDGDVSVQAFKITKKGEEIPLTQKGSMFLESSVKSIPTQSKRLGIGNTVNVPGTPISLKMPDKFTIKTFKPANPDAFTINKGLDEVGSFNLRTGQGKVGLPAASQGEKELLVGQKIIPNKKIQDIGIGLDITRPSIEPLKGARAPATGIVDVFQSEAKVLPKIQPPGIGKSSPSMSAPIVRASEGVKLAESRFTGFSIAEFSTKKMLDFEKYGKKSALSDSEKALFGPQKDKFTPFQFAAAEKPKPVKTSRAPLETQQEFDFDRSIMKTSLREGIFKREATSDIDTLGIKSGNTGGLGLGLGGNAEGFTNKMSLGFGGATGAERKGRSRVRTDEDFGIGFDFIQTPKGRAAPRSTDRLDIINPTTRASKGKSDLGKQIDSMSGLRLNNFTLTGRNTKTTTKGDILSVPKSDNTQLTRAFSTESFDFRQDTQQTTRTDTIPRLDTPTIPRTRDPFNTRGFLDFDFVKGPTKERRKGKGGKVQKRAFKATDPLSAVLGPKTKLGRRVQKLSDLYDDF